VLGRELWGQAPACLIARGTLAVRFGQRGCRDNDSATPECLAVVQYRDNQCRAEHTIPGCKSTLLILGGFSYAVLLAIYCIRFTQFHAVQCSSVAIVCLGSLVIIFGYEFTFL